jgi:hypothetical protein
MNVNGVTMVLTWDLMVLSMMLKRMLGFRPLNPFITYISSLKSRSARSA